MRGEKECIAKCWELLVWVNAGVHTYAHCRLAWMGERSAAQLLVVLRDHAMAVSKLQDVLKQDALDVSIMRQERDVGAQMLE